MNLVSPALIVLRILGWIWTEAWPEVASKWLSRRDLVQQIINPSYRQCLFNRCIKKRAHAQIVHLVFVDTLANPEKPKKLFFCQRLSSSSTCSQGMSMHWWIGCAIRNTLKPNQSIPTEETTNAGAQIKYPMPVWFTENILNSQALFFINDLSDLTNLFFTKV